MHNNEILGCLVNALTLKDENLPEIFLAAFVCGSRSGPTGISPCAGRASDKGLYTVMLLN